MEAGEGDLRGHSVSLRAVGSYPAPTRISEFRQKHLDELEDLFWRVFQICQRMGLVTLGNLALDGTR